MSSAELCPLCGGQLGEGTTTFTADFGDGVVVVRHVPARVCSQCGEAWVDDTQAARLEALDLKDREHVTVILQHVTPASGEEDWLDVECWRESAREADESVSLESVRQALSKIPGSLTADFIAEREDR